MSQIFIQTDSRVIDVTKISFMRTEGSGDVVVHFDGGDVMYLPRAEADAMLREMAGLKQIACLRAKTAGEWPKSQRRTKRREANRA